MARPVLILWKWYARSFRPTFFWPTFFRPSFYDQVFWSSSFWSFHQTFQAYKNGGGSFVFPCFVMLMLVGLPLVFLELALGQFAACGPTKLFGRMSPIFGGFNILFCFVVYFKSNQDIFLGMTGLRQIKTFLHLNH